MDDPKLVRERAKFDQEKNEYAKIIADREAKLAAEASTLRSERKLLEKDRQFLEEQRKMLKQEWSVFEKRLAAEERAQQTRLEENKQLADKIREHELSRVKEARKKLSAAAYGRLLELENSTPIEDRAMLDGGLSLVRAFHALYVNKKVTLGAVGDAWRKYSLRLEQKYAFTAIRVGGDYIPDYPKSEVTLSESWNAAMDVLGRASD